MKRMNFTLVGASFLLVAAPFAGGCDKDDDDGSADEADDDDDNADSGDGEDGDDSDGGDEGSCLGVDADASAGEGDPCTANADCNTGVCLLYQDVPLPEDAVCGATPEGCAVHITATVMDFVTGEPLPAQNVDIAEALVAASNPVEGNRIVTGTTGPDGRIDLLTPPNLEAPIGIVALIGGGDYHLTATGVAEPEEASYYGPGTGVHELWAVEQTMLTEWSESLADDMDASPYLPLGEVGGVVGIARDVDTGEPASGITIVPVTGTTQAIIRYLEPDGSFNSDATTETGIYVILAPGLAEKFLAERDGVEVHDNEGTVGSAANVVFTLVINVN
jgi:hypothetical protein